MRSGTLELILATLSLNFCFYKFFFLSNPIIQRYTYWTTTLVSRSFVRRESFLKDISNYFIQTLLFRAKSFYLISANVQATQGMNESETGTPQSGVTARMPSSAATGASPLASAGGGTPAGIVYSRPFHYQKRSTPGPRPTPTRLFKRTQSEQQFGVFWGIIVVGNI